MIKFNKNNNQIEPFTVILCNRNQESLGQIVNISNMNFKGNLNSANELSFEVHKTVDGYDDPLWDDIFDLRLVYISDLNEYFEINVSYTDQTYLTKTITATSLCEAELSQTMLYDIEINTEADIERQNPDGVTGNVSKFWAGADEDKSNTIIGRVLSKVPAYSVAHVDSTLINLQRVFTINGTSVYDWLVGECAKEFNCLVKFNSTNRTISFYDLYTTCPLCHARGLFNDKCTHIITDDDIRKYGVNGRINGRSAGSMCENRNLHYYGEDTTILVSTENLTDEIKYETDIGAVKNSFRLQAGDDDMTAAVININPNGSQYIQRFSPESLKDMPEALKEALDLYNDLYNTYRYSKIFRLNPGTYNTLIDKYNASDRYPSSHDNERLSQIPTSIRGYTGIMKHIYQAMDFYSYLESSMMPTVVIADVNINTEITKINQLTGQTVSLSSLNDYTTSKTVGSAVLNYIKIYVKTGFVNVEIDNSSVNYAYTGNEVTPAIWRGRFKVTDNSLDDSDDLKTGYSNIVTFYINDQYDNFMNQKIAKKIMQDTEENDDTFDVLRISNLELFKNRLTYYSLNRLQAFKDSIDAVLGILQEAGQGQAEKNSNYDSNYDPETSKYYYNVIISGTNTYEIYRTHVTYQEGMNIINSILYEGDEEGSLVIEGAELYESFYLPYYRKYKAVEEEYNRRSIEMEVVAKYVKDTMTDGVLYRLLMIRNEVHDVLDFEKFMNEYSQRYNDEHNTNYDLFKLLSTYTRQDEYNNSNYISVGLENEELFKMAEMFYEAAEEELLKSSTYQHSLTANLYNLLAMDEFAPIVDKFELGNWIRVSTDGNLYRLRLIGYSVDFEDPTTLSTEFSDVTVTGMGYNDLSSILDQANSMATSFPAVTRQAELGELAKSNINEWVERGLNSAKTRIMNNENEEIGISNVGITAKTVDDITGDYDKEQLRITHNVLAFTDDNWETVKTALGKFTLTHHMPRTNDSKEYQEEKYGLVAEAVLAGWVVGSTIEGGTIITPYIQNVGNSTFIDMGESKEEFISVDNGKFVIDKDGKFFSIGGHIGWPGKWPNESCYIDINGDDNEYPDFIHLKTATSVFSVSKADASITSSGGHYQNLGDTNYIDLGEIGGDYEYFLKCGDYFSVDKYGYLVCTSGMIGGFYIGDTFLTTGIKPDRSINHGENDVSLSTVDFTGKIKTVHYNEDPEQDTRSITSSTGVGESIEELRIAFGNDYGVTSDGHIYGNELSSIATITKDLRCISGVFCGDSDNSNWTEIHGGEIETQWVHSLGSDQARPVFNDQQHGNSIAVQQVAFFDDGQVFTRFSGSTDYAIPWMVATAAPNPPAPNSLPENCIYLIYEDNNYSV